MDANFRKRLRKTLYCGDLKPGDASLALTDLSVEYFQGLAPHKLGYIDLHSASTITSHDTVSTSSVAMGMIYAKRLQRKRPDYVGKMSSSDLFLISMMMASKYLYDEGVDEEVFNDEWAEMADLEKDEVNHMEREFLDAMDWELFIKKDEFDHTMLSIERSVALQEGLRRGWFSYTDLCALWEDPRLAFWVSDVGLEWLKVALISSAAYFAAAMTMVGSTVLVTNASLMLASYGVLPALLPGLQPSMIPGPLPQFQGLPPLPAVEFFADRLHVQASPTLPHNETAHMAAEEKLRPELTSQDVSQVPGETILETIMSQLMAVLTLKSHLVQFVSAVADYTSTRTRNYTRKEHESPFDCTSGTGAALASGHEDTSAADMYARWLEMARCYGSDSHFKSCCCCGKEISHGNGHVGFMSPMFMFFGASSQSLSMVCCSNVGRNARQHQRGSVERGFSCSWSLGQLCRLSSPVAECSEKVAGFGTQHLFQDITVGFTTSTLLPVYAT